MSKLLAIVVTAAVCLPLGALLRGEASAERRINAPGMKNIIEGHRHLSRAQAAMDEARTEIELSQQANEALWSDETGRAASTKTSVDRAAAMLDGTADWVRNGMARNGDIGTDVGTNHRRALSYGVFVLP